MVKNRLAVKVLIMVTIFIFISLTFILQGTESYAQDNLKSLKSIDGDKIPVLLYHHFMEKVPENLYGTTISPAEFEEQLKYLKENGYNSITFSELLEHRKDGKKLPPNPFILTIDDGYLSNYIYAYPLLKKYNTKAAIFIVAASAGKTPGIFPHFTWEQAREMEKSGLVEIQNHGLNHTDHAKMAKKDLIEDVEAAQALIDKNLGKRALKVFAYPGGRYSTESRLILSKIGFNIQLTGISGLITTKTELNNIKRINVGHGISGKGIANIVRTLENK